MVLLTAIILLLAGCGKPENNSQQTDIEEQNQGSEGQNAADDIQTQEQTDAGDGKQAPEESQVQDQGIVSTKTQAEYEEEKRAERAILEEKVKEVYSSQGLGGDTVYYEH